VILSGNRKEPTTIYPESNMVKVRSTKKSPSQRRDPRLRYLVEAETAEQFWTNQKWPADSSEYVFLARAFNLIGTKQCDPEWTGKEWSKAADLSDWITAREVRRIKVQNEMIEAMEKGELISGYRALSGGQVIVMPRYFWNSEVSLLQNRFELCRIDIGEPFKRISNPIKGSWIYIALKSLHRYVGVKAERRTKGSIKGTRLRGAIEALDALYPAGRFPAGVTNTIILAEVNSWLKTKGRQDVSLSSIRRAREIIQKRTV
jgi:hypothetical protein